MNRPKVALIQFTVVELREIADYCARVAQREPFMYFGVTKQRLCAQIAEKVNAVLVERLSVQRAARQEGGA